MNRKRLLKVIKEVILNYIGWVSPNELSDIIFEYGERGRYIEALTGDAGRGDSFCYLSYYDENAKAVILIKDIGWRIDGMDSPEAIADFIIELDNLYHEYRNKFLALKKD